MSPWRRLLAFLGLRREPIRYVAYGHLNCHRPGANRYLFDTNREPVETWRDAKPHPIDVARLEVILNEPRRPRDPVYVCHPAAAARIRKWYAENMSDQTEQR